VGADIWTIRIYEDGKVEFEETGFGNSQVYKYEFESGTPIVDTSVCKSFSDCDDDAPVCVGGQCISDGNPRFTLQWPGKSMYSLTVVTPAGTHISGFKPFDPDSGGIFEGPTHQFASGTDVESIYFSIDGGPPGLYIYYVSNSGGQVSDETWTLTVSVDGEDVATQSGSSSSDLFSFQYKGEFLPLEDDTTSVSDEDEDGDVASPECDPSKSECCLQTADCSFDEICVHNICAKKGAPQFLLSWQGDHDLSLSVVTPVQTTLSWQNKDDSDSGGSFHDYRDNIRNRRIENIYFSPEDGPFGAYPYYIHSFQDGDEDYWTLTIYVDGKEISTESGQGSSEVLFFHFDKAMVSEKCDPLAIGDSECCSSSECFPNEACASQTCVDEGNPRFTLSWKGIDDLDLLVVTPLGGVVSLSNMEDEESGGKFGEDFDQFQYGLHVENIYFPLSGSPIGEYSFYVRSFLSFELDDDWTVGVYVDGRERYSVSGTGNSPKHTFSFIP